MAMRPLTAPQKLAHGTRLSRGKGCKGIGQVEGLGLHGFLKQVPMRMLTGDLEDENLDSRILQAAVASCSQDLASTNPAPFALPEAQRQV